MDSLVKKTPSQERAGEFWQNSSSQRHFKTIHHEKHKILPVKTTYNTLQEEKREKLKICFIVLTLSNYLYNTPVKLEHAKASSQNCHDFIAFWMFPITFTFVYAMHNINQKTRTKSIQVRSA